MRLYTGACYASSLHVPTVGAHFGANKAAPGQPACLPARPNLAVWHRTCDRKGSSWEPPKERLLFSLAGLFGLLRLVHANAKEQRDLLLLHLPHSQVQALKAVAASEWRAPALVAPAACCSSAANRPMACTRCLHPCQSMLAYANRLFFRPCQSRVDILFRADTCRHRACRSSPRPLAEGNSDLVISTGDVVQATAGLVMHAALGLPLLPVEPKGMHVVMQVLCRGAVL